MTFAEAILAAMLQLTCPADEPKEGCAQWRAQVSEAVAQAAEEATCTSNDSSVDCRPVWPGAADELAAYLIEVANHESGLRRRIQEDRCRDDECDSTWRWKNGKHKHTGHLARSMWQLHASPNIPGVDGDVPREDWLAAAGLDPSTILVAARCAARLVAHNPGAFGLTLGSKGPRGVAAWKILARIRTARAEQAAASARAQELR